MSVTIVAPAALDALDDVAATTVKIASSDGSDCGDDVTEDDGSGDPVDDSGR